ncbi:hypothetical protein EW145_g4651 [Phellinidium pouzarii]|uniref:F-box domain-containing protein n=1 Tax=Phellinidium pouzarii TaxID=167371 RepID=A0A4S4L2S0_9AGAM|nr:hypothetical protein EW145_g4651 [Phellinidium pouzarii]
MPVLKSLTLTGMSEKLLVTCFESLSQQPDKLQQLEFLSIDCEDVMFNNTKKEEGPYRNLYNIHERIAPSLRTLEISGTTPFVHRMLETFKPLDNLTLKTLVVNFGFVRYDMEYDYEPLSDLLAGLQSLYICGYTDSDWIIGTHRDDPRSDLVKNLVKELVIPKLIEGCTSLTSIDLFIPSGKDKEYVSCLPLPTTLEEVSIYYSFYDTLSHDEVLLEAIRNLHRL